jgi:hypothetical protein
LNASRDLIHWSAPQLVMSTATLLAAEPAGSWGYGYFSLLDPAATDRSFATITSHPMVYYVRMDALHPPYRRILARRPLSLNIR